VREERRERGGKEEGWSGKKGSVQGRGKKNKKILSFFSLH
jgi:hypothetical protein